MKTLKQLKLMIVIIGILSLLCVNAVRAEEQTAVRIVASIKPLALLIQELTSDSDLVEVLLESNQNHHIARLKPSQRQKVAQADLVFFINEKFELFVKNIRDSDSNKRKYIEVSNVSGLRLLSLRQSGQMPHALHTQKLKKLQIQQQVFQQHNHGGVDWHIWLNPDNAIVILMNIRDELTRLFPQREEEFQQRYESFSQRLVAENAKKSKMIMDVVDKPFFVLHDGLQYFEEQYGLQSKGIILEKEGNSASARHLIDLRKIRKAENVNIVIKDEQFSDRVIKTLAGDRPFKVIAVDSLAQGSLSEVDNFFDYYDAIAENLFIALSVKD